MKWKNVSIQSKIIIMGISIILIFSLTIFLYFIPSTENAILETKKEKIKDIIDSAAHTIESMSRDYHDGKISGDEFRKNVINYVKNVRYGPEGKDYLWINDLGPTMIFHPYRPEMNGKSLADHKDPTGKRFFVEMVNVCRATGAGYVNYMWQYKDDASRVVAKISYVRLIPGLSWIIGTGIYELDVRQEVQGRVRAIQARLALVVFGITVLLIAFALLMSRSIKRTIDRCVATVEGIARGDLTQRVDLDQKDEIGRLARALDKAIGDLESILSLILAGAQNLSQAVEQISAGNENLSQRTNEQASSIEEIASTIEEATATTNQNTGNSSSANRMAQSAVEAITTINEKSAKIVDIINVINEIAFQTNLLALNAAIEAARAGEQGRGFAVVAGEVRNLAQRSGNSAREIEGLIKEAVDSVQSGTRLVNDVSRIVNEIALASEEQQQGINQINIAISQLDTMTQQNASLVEETASASEEMANQAQEFMDLVSRFKVKNALNSRASGEKHRKHGSLRMETETAGIDGNGRHKPLNKPVPESPHPTAVDNLRVDVIENEGYEEF